MAGSEAEERIRAKAEALLRKTFPEARIVHELVLRQGGVRIDLAAITVDRLVCIEIKSERDVLTRLPEQVEAMRRVCDTWRVCVAEKYVEKCRDIAGWGKVISEDRLTGDGYEGRDLLRDAMSGLCNAPARLDMLWAEELRRIAGQGPRANRRFCTTAASDYQTGAQVRRAVCGALRARPFPRADPAIEWPLLGALAA